jgi:hypothetical protein
VQCPVLKGLLRAVTETWRCKEAKKQPYRIDSDIELRDFENAKAECVFQPNKDR